MGQRDGCLWVVGAFDAETQEVALASLLSAIQRCLNGGQHAVGLAVLGSEVWVECDQCGLPRDEEWVARAFETPWPPQTLPLHQYWTVVDVKKMCGAEYVDHKPRLLTVTMTVEG